ncbi:UDP-N-acetylglucosamine 4,6-dehydratase (EC [Olavius algarvensis Delta 1 endosymbiont]|nr:UDP-N-acetylglucosamine 4,6-dehydratase (EC [Olavius algarvensis Delta 1 endosymbiont]
MIPFFKDKRVLVTGACGTVGLELIRQLLKSFDVCELIGIDNNESELFFLEDKFADFDNVSFFLADVRDRDKISRKMKHMDVVFHTAAFKHVILCERSPFEAVQTNILGIQNIINGAIENNVKQVIFTSSDKAVNPTNVMGASKLMGERLMAAANSNSRDNGPIFTSTRFGNVLGSRGSVIPIFHDQIRQGGPVTLTDPTMTRFIMSLEGAIQLVIESACEAVGGEVFITKMPAIRIIDLAQVMINELAPGYGFNPEDVEIQHIGNKPGEKMFEELMNEEEIRRAWELEKYFVLLPAYGSIYRKFNYHYSNAISKTVNKPYNSANHTPLSQSDLAKFLHSHKLLN